MERRNVLQLVGSFHQGGSERQAVQLTRLLHEDGEFKIFVAALNAQGVLRPEIERLNLGEISEFRLNSFYDANFVRQIHHCRRFIRENNIEIVHTHDFYTNVFGISAACLAKVRGRIASKRETGEMRSAAQKLIEKQVFHLSRAIVVNADAVREFLVKQSVDERKISVIYNGLHLERLKPTQSRADSLREFDLPPNKKIVSIVANLRHPVKNICLFLRAAALVKAKFPNAIFAIAGEGELLGEYQNLAAELSIAGNVFFLGRCTKVADLLAISDVCVLSSRAEGFSNSILEYMAARRPVVVTRVGGAAEAVRDGENGFLVESNDAAAMAEKILFLLENKETAREFGERGRQIVEEKFSCAAQLEKTKELYRQLLKKSV